MRTSIVILSALALLTQISCVSPVKAPTGTVPNRNKLETDTYGSYIRIHTRNNHLHLGELIGLRNDSLIVLGDSVVSIPVAEVDSARVIVHSPASYTAGLLTLVPNLALLGHAGAYGGGPVAMAVLLSLIDLVGYGAAVGTENAKINYLDWSVDSAAVLRYARFPGGVPETIPLSALEPRRITRKN